MIDKKFIEWQNNLKVGDRVEGRFTNCYNFYGFIGVITKLNQNSVRILPDKPVYQGDKEGRTFIIPLFTLSTIGKKWSVNNGVFPISIKE